MSNTKHVIPASRETLPGALFVVDDDATIVYANASAQAMLGATRKDVFGKSLWRCAPRLVSTSLYQAVQKTKQTREPTEVEYVSPVTNIWLYVSLSPTEKGLAIFFHEHLKPSHLQNALSQNEQMYRDLLESFANGVTILTPDGLVLDINQPRRSRSTKLPGWWKSCWMSPRSRRADWSIDRRRWILMDWCKRSPTPCSKPIPVIASWCMARCGPA